MVAETLYEYGIGLLQHGHLFRSDVAENSDCQPRPRERMTADEMFGHSELASDGAHFVLE